MRRKSTKKGDRKNKRKDKGTKASTKKKKNKAGNKKRNTGKATKKRSHKLQILSAGSASSPHAEPTEPKPKKSKKSRKKTNKFEETATAKKAAPKAKVAATRAAPKAKTAAKKAAAKPKPKAKGKPKAGAKRSRKTAVDALLESPFRHNELIRELKEWVEFFGPEYDQPDQKNKYKAAVRESLYPLEKTSLNIYWSRCGCGVKNAVDSQAAYKAKDWCNFSFNQGLAPARWKMAMAVRCAEMVVSKQRI